jgi:hypothetical protein
MANFVGAACLQINMTRSYKKDYEPLLNLTEAMSSCSREKVLLCTQKSPVSKYRGFGWCVYWMNKQSARGKRLKLGQMRQFD